MSTRLPLLAATALLAHAPLAAAQQGEEPGGTAVLPSQPVFEATLTDATTVAGRVADVSLGDDPGVTLVGEDGPPARIPLDRLVKLTRRGGADAPFPPSGSLVVLPEGDRLRASIGASDGDTVEVLPTVLDDKAARLPLDRVLGLILAPPADPDAMAELIGRVRAQPRDGDVLWQSNGDRLTGSFLGLDGREVAFDPGAGRAAIDRARTVAIGFDPTLIAYPPAESPYLELTLDDGSRVGATACRVDGGDLVAATRMGPELRLPWASIARVHARGGSVAYLSEREPLGAQYVPYLDDHPETFGRDATWDGRHLRLAGKAYDRGLGMLPRTLVAYRLQPGDGRFQALVGLDDRAGPEASVVFRVTDESRRELFASPVLTRRDAPIAVDVDLAGSKVLVLLVEFGDRGDVQDYADWVEARIVR